MSWYNWALKSAPAFRSVSFFRRMRKGALPPTHWTSSPSTAIPDDRNVDGQSPCCKNTAFKAFEPLAFRHIGVGFKPVLQLEEVRAGNPALLKSFDQVIQNALRRRFPDLWHLRIRVLLMKNDSFELIRKLPDLVWVVGAFYALQQTQDSPVGCVHVPHPSNAKLRIDMVPY